MHGINLLTICAETDNFALGQQFANTVVYTLLLHFKPSEDAIAADNDCRFSHLLFYFLQITIQSFNANQN